MANRKRLFIAVDPNPEVLGRVTRWLEQVRAMAPKAMARWSSPENLHITLKFLGSTDEDDLPMIQAAILAVASATAGFSVGIRGTGVFPSEDRPRVLWLGIEEGADQLKEIAAELDERLAKLGFEREVRVYHPHLTLARATERRIARHFLSHPLSGFGMFPAREIVLYESVTKPSGSEYTPIFRASLSDVSRESSLR